MGQFFAVFATDNPDVHSLRQHLRPTHQAHLRSPDAHHVVVRLGGPTLDEESTTMNGTLLVIEAQCLSDVEAFMQDDPYVQAGLFASMEIRPWNWSLGNPELRSQL